MRKHVIKGGLLTEIIETYLDMEGTLEEVRNRLTELGVKHSKTHMDVFIDSVQREYEEGMELVLKGSRSPTPGEQAEWDAKIAEEQVQQVKWDLERLKILRAKYPGK